MKKYLIKNSMIYKNLIKSLIIILLLSSCSISFHGNLHKIEKRQLNTGELKSVFNDGFNKVLFKTRIQLYNKYFSGLLFIKSIGDNTKRIVFVTEIGIKIFEFEFINNDFNVHSCLETFNKKVILKTLEKDIKLLLMINLAEKKVKIFEAKKSKNKVYKLKENCQSNYYFIDKETGNLLKIENSSGIFRKVIIELNDYKEGFPNKINIVHPGIKLNIQLKLIER